MPTIRPTLWRWMPMVEDADHNARHYEIEAYLGYLQAKHPGEEDVTKSISSQCSDIKCRVAWNKVIQHFEEHHWNVNVGMEAYYVHGLSSLIHHHLAFHRPWTVEGD